MGEARPSCQLAHGGDGTDLKSRWGGGKVERKAERMVERRVERKVERRVERQEEKQVRRQVKSRVRRQAEEAGLPERNHWPDMWLVSVIWRFGSR